MKKYQLYLEGLDCNNCALELEKELKEIEGISDVEVIYPDCIFSFICEEDNFNKIKEEAINIIKELEPEIDVEEEHHECHDHCSCHHDHHHHHEEERIIIENDKTRKYRIEGLDCENCAKHLEEKLNEIKGINNVYVSYIHERISFECEDADLEKIKKEVYEITKKEEEEAIIYFEEGSQEIEMDNDKLIISRLIIGLILFIISLFLSANLKTIIVLIAYLILGYDVLLKAIKNIGKGQLFDENFLMAIATIAAIYLGEYSEATAVMLFYQVGEFLQDLAVKHSRKSISSLMDIRSDIANVIRNGEIIRIDPSEVEIGEIIIVKPGEKIALDGIIIEGSSSLNTSSLTGESILKDVDVGDEVISGTVNETGVIKIKTTKRFADSSVQKILSLIEEAEIKKSSHERFITKFAKYYTPLVVVAAILTACFTYIITKDINSGIYRACTFLVISCPCALVISIPLSFFAGIGGLSRKGILVKGADVIESLSQIKNIIFDKTGTITKGEFVVAEIKDASNKDEILELAALAEMNSNHPLAKAIQKDIEIKDSNIKDIQEIAGRGIKANIHGDDILVGNYKFMQESNIDVPLYHKTSNIYVAKNNKYEGCILLKDEIKDNAKKTINELKDLNIKTVLVSGDTNSIVEEVVNILDINEAYSECLPQEKVEKVRNIQTEGPCAFVGDGLNDAPVLLEAEVGIAMGGLGSDAAIEASDIVVMDDNIAKVPLAYKNSKRIIQVAKENIVGAILIKILILILGALGKADMWMAIFADTGVALLCIINALRLLKVKE